jgi:hypothetical protein
MKNWLRYRAVRHLLFWGGVCGFFGWLALPPLWLGAPQFYDFRTFVLVQLPGCVLGTYALLYGVLPRLLGGGPRWPGLLLLLSWVLSSVLLTSSLQAFYTFIIAPVLGGAVPDHTFSWAALAKGGTDFSFFGLVVVAGGAAAIKVANSWHEQQRLSQHIQQRRLQTELSLLRAQLQPGFLFSTLATLRTLTSQRSLEAPGAVLHLSDLLRYHLYDSAADAVPLAEEANMLRHYVALEQLRLGPGVDVALSSSGDLAAHRIAPLLLLPLVENAFRHGTGPAQECPWVSIDLVARPQHTIIKVINGQASDATWPGEGPGLRTLRARLERLYPDRHELKIVSEPDIFLVTLHLRPAPLAAARTAGQPALSASSHAPI